MKIADLKRLLAEATNLHPDFIAGHEDYSIYNLHGRWSICVSGEKNRQIRDLVRLSLLSLPALLAIAEAAGEFSAADLAVLEATEAGKSRRETSGLYDEALRTSERLRTALAALEGK